MSLLLVAAAAANQELAVSQSKVQQQVTKCEEADAKVIADEIELRSSRAKAATARAQVEETKLEFKQKQQAAKMAERKLKKRRSLMLAANQKRQRV